MPAKVVKYAHKPIFLKTKSKAACNAKTAGIRILEVVASEIEIEAEDFKDIPHTHRVFPIWAVCRGLQRNVSWCAQGDIPVRQFTPGRSKTYDFPQIELSQKRNPGK